MSDLLWMAERIGRALAALTDDTHLVISREGSDAYVGEGGSNRYVQFARFDGCIRAESVGDRYLSGPDRLTSAQGQRLEELGWDQPDGSGNHWRHFAPPLELTEIARLALRTLEEVHGARYLEQLDFSAPADVIMALGSPREDAVNTRLNR